MRARWTIVAVLAACGNSEPQTPPAAPPATAQRYADELAIDHAAALAVATAPMLAAVPSGTVLGTLARGARATALAGHAGFWLVRSSGLTPVTGWVAGLAFDPTFEARLAAEPPLSSPCTGTKLGAFADHARCTYRCTTTAECRGTGTCEAAALFPVVGPLTFATVCTPDPNAPPPAPAAGPPSVFGSAHTSTGGCPPGFAVAPELGKLCYRTCTTDRNCPTDATCKVQPSGSFCFAS